MGVPCWAAMWVRPVSTPTTARQALSTSTASPGVAATTLASPRSTRALPPSPRVTTATSRPRRPSAAASSTQRSGAHRFAVPSASATNRTRPSASGRSRDSSGSRCREVADHSKIGPDTGDDLVDRQGAVGGRKFWRPPPVVTLQWVVAQVDERIARSQMAMSPSATVPARPLTRSARAAWLVRPGHQPGLGARASVGAHRRLHHREGDDEISQAERHRGDESPTWGVHGVAYSVVSARPSSLKAS